MTAWHLDVLDARAGLAFASYRHADLGEVEPDMAALAVFIAAPEFQPETLASRATGLAAARGSAQLGLFYEGSEIGFASLDDVVEFVRRCYLAGGGGDGGGGIGPGVPRRPEGPAPEGSKGKTPFDVGDFASDAAKPIQNMFGRLSEMAREQQLIYKIPETAGAFFLAESAHTSAVQGSTAPAADVLALGAATALVEMWRRYPPACADFAAWWQGMQCLCGEVDRLGLSRRLIASKAVDPWDHMPSRRTHLFGPWTETFEAFLQYVVHGYEKWGAGVDDPFEDLARLPLPEDTATRLQLSVEDASLADLVALAIGAPTTFAESKPADVSLLLFAICHLIRNRGSAPKWGQSEVAANWRNTLVADALTWLRQNLPTQMFPLAIEAMIASVREPRYV